jgi:cobalt-zinc-cadmium efflux system outer membrane protein
MRTSRGRECVHGVSVAIVVMSGIASVGLQARQVSAISADGASLDVNRQGPYVTGPVTPLRVLIEELQGKSPAVAAARAAAEAASHVAPQVTTLPDPRVTFQQFNVGSPRPFAGWSNSDFAYVGVGVSQDLPFPGKRQLRRDVATHEVDRLTAHVDVIRRQEIERLATAYCEVAYHQQTLDLLERDDVLSRQVADVAAAHYRAGQGTEQDVLRAQLEHTKILNEIAMHHRQMDEAEVDLKQTLRRSQDSPDIAAEALIWRPWPVDPTELLTRVRDQNATLREDAGVIDKRTAEVTLAEKDHRPDFAVGGMYQHTSSAFRDYYMLTFDVVLPRASRVNAAVAQATARVEQARADEDADLQATLADLARQVAIARVGDDQATLYRDGLLPQARASFDAGLVAYQAGRQGFESVLSSMVDLLTFDLEYQQLLLDRALAIAHVERLMGGPLS